jgi:hypothetical protein
VELGRIDIINEVSMLPTHLFFSCEGHLEAVFHVFAYLGLHQNASAFSGKVDIVDIYIGPFRR